MVFQEILPNLGPTRKEEQIKSEAKRKANELKEKLLSGKWSGEEVGIDTFKNMTLDEFKAGISYDIELNAITIFGKPVDFWMNQTFFPKEKIDEIDKFKKFIENADGKFEKQQNKKELLVDIVNIWGEQAKLVANNLLLKSFRDDEDIINQNLESIYKILSDIIIPINDEIFNSQVEKVFDLILNSEEETSIIGKSDLKEVKNTFFDEGLPKDMKLRKVLNKMRYGGISGNSEGVKEVLSRKILERPDFKDVNDILGNPEIYKYIKSGNKKQLENILGKDLAEEINSKYKKIKKGVEEQDKNVLKSEVEEINKDNLANGEPEISVEQLIKENIKETTNLYLKHLLIRNKIDSWNYRGNDSSLTGMYANLTGLSKDKGSFSDLMTPADENIDLLIETGLNLAIASLSLGAGTLAMNLGKGAIGLVGRGAKTIETASKLNTAGRLTKLAGKTVETVGKYSKLGKVTMPSFVSINGVNLTYDTYISHLIGNSVLDGITFYEGATIVNTVLRGKIETLKKDMTNGPEIAKSILFMGGLNSLSYISKLPGYEKITSFSQRMPEKYLSKEATQMIIKTAGFQFSTGSIFVIGGIIEDLFGQGWHPTVKEYLELSVLLYGMGKFHH